MKYAQTDTQEQANDLKLAIFDAGAPMTAVLFANHWDEESKGVYASSRLEGGTFALDTEFEQDGKWLLKHIDEYVFHPYTYQYYMDTYPDNEAIQNRIPRDEEGEPLAEWLEKTPAQYVSEVIIGNNFQIIDFDYH
jgi:hypothetical protein